jgi:hypothetical protein
VFVVAAVSWEEKDVLLKDVLAEDKPEGAVWKDRAMLRVGFTNCGGAMGEDLIDLTVCFPLEVLVNFAEFSERPELS